MFGKFRRPASKVDAIAPSRVFFGVSTADPRSGTSGSGRIEFVTSIPLPDGSRMKLLNRDVFERALAKAKTAS
jgi:hypothetical protein